MSESEHISKSWSKLRENLRLCEEKYSLAGFLRNRFQLFRYTGRYLTLRFVLLIAMVVLAATDVSLFRAAASIISLYLILEILVAHLSIAYVSRAPVDRLRSVVFALFSFFQLAIGFAVFFAALGSSFVYADNAEGKSAPMRIGFWSSLYFSLLIITTIGWGDIIPSRDAWHLKAIIALELVVAFSFLATVLQIFVSWSSQHQTDDHKDLNRPYRPRLGYHPSKRRR